MQVLILGKGQSAFETAQHIYGETARIDLFSRSRPRLALQTHYVGDVRAINMQVPAWLAAATPYAEPLLQL